MQRERHETEILKRIQQVLVHEDFFIGPTNAVHLFDHPLWSIFLLTVTHTYIIYTLKISIYVMEGLGLRVEA